MPRNLLRVFPLLAVLLLTASPLHAQSQGDACSVAGKVYTTDTPGVPALHCESGTLQNFFIPKENAAMSCTAVREGALQYIAATDTWNFCNGSAWTALASGSGATDINGLSDAYADYTTLNNLIMGRTSAAALAAGAQYNTFVGELAGATTANSTATTDENTALGYHAMQSLTSGTQNTAVGAGALQAVTTGSVNTAVGNAALVNTTTGGWNTAVGWRSLYYNTTGDDNTGIGQDALINNTTGSSNTAVGKLALSTNVAKRESTAVGFDAMRYADSTATGAATYNTALGAYALRGSTTAANNTGTQNTAVGHSALIANTSGAQNTAVGKDALTNNTTAYGNTAVGESALAYVTSNSESTAIGMRALRYNTGAGNTALGYAAGFGSFGSSTGSDNVLIGRAAGGGITSGINNVFLGSGTGDTTTTGGTNILIGYNVDAPANNTNNYLNIGGSIYGDMSTGNLTLAGTAALTLPRGDTSQRPGTAVEGMIRYNSQTDKFEGYQASAWQDIITAGGTPAGSDTQIQFNSGGAFGANANFVFTSAGRLGVGTATPGGMLHLTGTPTAAATSALMQITGPSTSFAGGHASGQMFGINSASGYTGNLMTLATNGTTKLEVRPDGSLIVGPNAAAGSNSILAAQLGSGTVSFMAGQTLSVIVDRVTINPSSIVNSSGTMGMFNVSIPDSTTGTGGFTGIRVNKTGSGTGSGAKSLIDLQIGGVSQFVVDAGTGNVGIGTTTPQSTLHVPDGKYAQFEDNNAGAPPGADCDADTERGRMSIDTTNNRLYICNGATRGWDYTTLTD